MYKKSNPCSNDPRDTPGHHKVSQGESGLFHLSLGATSTRIWLRWLRLGEGSIPSRPVNVVRATQEQLDRSSSGGPSDERVPERQRSPSILRMQVEFNRVSAPRPPVCSGWKKR